MVNRSEIRRLEKAVKEKDKKKLVEWAQSYETQISSQLRIIYNNAYKDEIEDSITNMLIALAYTLYYSEEIEIKPENIPDFLADLLSTIDTYKTGECNPNEYREELEKIGIRFREYDYNKLYREKIDRLNQLIEEYNNKIELLDTKLNELNI